MSTEHRWYAVIAFALLAITASPVAHAQTKRAGKQADGNAVADVGRYHFRSNPWVNLHQRLLAEANGYESPPPPAGLSGDELAQWVKAVERYRAFIHKRSELFDRELVRINTVLSETMGQELPKSIPDAAAVVLRAGMPLYRKAQWMEDDRANRFWVAVVTPLLVSAGEELADAHAKVYGFPFPKHILVDVCSFGGQFGAYTVGEGESAHVVVMSTNGGTQGFGSLESMMHEPSHAIVDATSWAIGSDITRLAKELNVKPRYNLWHAILFYTSGELTRQALATRGVSGYHPFILDMYRTAFAGFQQPLETHWQAYLDGKVSRDEALRQILIETPAPPPKPKQ